MSVTLRYNIRVKSHAGLSLVETLIAIGLLGVVLIPMLFLSSAYFLSQLTRTREGIDATHGASTFLNRFFEEAALSQRILTGSGSGTGQSDNDAIYLAYYEPITQKSYRIGYRLTTVTGGRKLERLEYNMATSTWDVVSPYSHIKPSEVLLPSTAQFQYCVDTTCSSPLTGTSVQNALLVRLHDTSGTGWSFTKGRQTFQLQQNTAVVLSTSIPAGQVILSDQAKEMYTINLTQTAESSPTETLVNLNPVGEAFNYLTSVASGGAGVLSTLNSTAQQNPGYSAYRIGTAVDSSGRVFWGGRGSTALQTWKAGVLSTISTAVNNMGNDTIVASDDRVFFGTDGSTKHFYSWKNNVLSTLTPTGMEYPGAENSMAVAPNGRVYFGSYEGPTGYLRTWYNNVLSTLGPAMIYPGGQYAAVANPATNGVYWSCGIDVTSGSLTPGGNLYYWEPGMASNSPTQIPLVYANNCFVYTLMVASSGRVYFGDDNYSGNNNYYTWFPSTNVLSTILTGKDLPGYSARAVVPGTEQVYFSGYDGIMWSYTPNNGVTTNVLSTVMTSATYYGLGQEGRAIQAFSDGRVVFAGLRGSVPYPGLMYTWKQGVGLSTIFTAEIHSPGGYYSLKVDDNTGNAYFGQAYQDSSTNTRLFWVWNKNTNVLSTILPTAVTGSTIGAYNVTVASDGRVFFGVSNNTGNFWTWKDNILSTILPTDVTNPGKLSTAVTSDGRVFFGSAEGSGYMRTWAPGSPTYSMVRYTTSGISTYQSLAVTSSGSHTYTLNIQDLTGDLYLLDTANNKLDRYVYSASTQQYAYVSSLTVSGSSSNGAVAVDQASSGVSFLDTTNDTIEVFNDRQSTSTLGTPDSSYALSGLGSSPPTNPTGLAINQRTGDYLILDSTVQSSGATAYVRLFVVNSSVNTVRQIIPIKVNDTQFISTDLRAETNFKIQYDDRKNILYLTAPSVDKTYVLSLPILL